jgi:hypothetical protein
MALTQAQLTAAINSQLQAQLQNAWGDDSTLGEKWLTTGSTGGAIIYPQGQQGDATSAAYYYPTYQALNKTVSTDENGVSSISDTTFTSYLTTLYGDMYYALSTESQNAMAKANQEYNNDISKFYNDVWIPVFGSESTNYKNNAGGSQAWVVQVGKGESNISPDLMMQAIQSSYTWSTGNAYKSPFGMKSQYKNINPQTLMEDYLKVR